MTNPDADTTRESDDEVEDLTLIEKVERGVTIEGEHVPVLDTWT